MNQFKRFLTVNLIDVIITSIIWNKPYKATRKAWWLSKIYFLVFFMLSLSPVNVLSQNIFMVFLIIALIFGFYTQINISVKRFHDIGMSGALVWLLPIPLVGLILSLILGFCHSETEVENKMTIKKLFLISFNSKYHSNISNKTSALAFLLSLFVCLNLYVFILLITSALGGLITGVSGGRWEASWTSILLTISVGIAALTFVYSSRLILKRRNR